MERDLSRAIGPALKGLRIRRGLTAAEMSSLLGLNMNGVYKREAETANITLKTLGEHLSALEVTLHDLADEVEGPAPRASREPDPAALVTARRSLPDATEQDLRAYVLAASMIAEGEATLERLEARYGVDPVLARLRGEGSGPGSDDGGE